MVYIETARLRLRDWEKTDLKPFREMNADEEVTRSLIKSGFFV